VLTKPDRIPFGEEESWLGLIRNEVEPLLNNWYCVKQPCSQMIKDGIDWAGARRHESEFFATTQPWCGLDSYYQSFLRTTKLTDRLSTILAELIAKRCEAFLLCSLNRLVDGRVCVRRLPEIQDELYKVMQITEERLRALPQEPSNDPVGEVLRVLGGFQKEVSERLEGTPDETGLLQTIRPHTEKFKREIHGTTPNFVPWERKENIWHKLPPAGFLSTEEKVGNADDDGDDGMSGKYSKSPKKHMVVVPLRNVIYIEDVMQRAQKLVVYFLPFALPDLL